MKKLRKIAAVIICMCLVLSLFAACSDKQEKAKKITIAYQGGIGYAPIHVMAEKKLIENNYDGEIEVEFVKLDSGAAINEGIIGGTVDIGCMGLAPAISGVSAGIPYKMISNLCAQSHGLMSNNPEIKSLSDITDKDKIALVSTGSIQHILLSMAAEKVLGDAHALDNNIQGMSHAEGMAALESGTVSLHLTSSPFIYQERANEKYNEISDISEVWPSGNSFLVAMAASSLKEDEKLFSAITKAFDDAMSFIETDKAGLAEIEVKYLELDAATVDDYLSQPDCMFFADVRGAEAMASFMFRAGFIEKEVTMSDFLYDGVSGK